jgi:hypothetical protein
MCNHIALSAIQECEMHFGLVKMQKLQEYCVLKEINQSINQLHLGAQRK